MYDGVDSSSLQDLLENALDPILVTIGRSIVFFNSPAQTLTGFDHYDRSQLDLEMLFPPGQDARRSEILRASQPDAHVPFPFCTLLSCRDGSLRPVEVTALKTTWQGRPAAFLILRDTSRRTEEVAHLREIEQNLRFVIENTNDAVVVISDEGKYVYANRRATEFTGVPVEEMLGIHVGDVLHPDDAPAVVQTFQDRIAGRPVPRRYETRLRHRNGTDVPVELTAFATTWRGQLADVVVVRDLTAREAARARLREEQEASERLRQEVEEHRRTEEALRTSERRFRDVAEASGEYIWEINSEGRITYVSDRVTAILGFTPEQLLGHTPFEFGEPSGNATFLPNLSKAFESGQKPLLMEQRVRSASGMIVLLQVRILPIRDGTGRLQGYRGTALDITAHRQAEEALRRRDAILEAVSLTAEQLLRSEKWDQNIEVVLESFGRAADADRSSLYVNYEDERGVLHTVRRARWLRPGLTPMPSPEVEEGIPLAGFFPLDWIRTSAAGRPIMFSHGHCSAELQILLERLNAVTVLSVPILVAGRFWGMLSLSNSTTGAIWQPSEIEAFAVAAKVVGAAIEREQAVDALQRKDQILEAVGLVTERLLGSPRWEDAVDGVMERLIRASAASRGTIFQILPGENGDAAFQRRFGWCSPDWPLLPGSGTPERMRLIAEGFGPYLETLAGGQSLVAPPPEATEEQIQFLRKFGARTILVLPILPHRKLWGLLVISQCGQERAWSQPETEALRAAADSLAVVIERQEAGEAQRDSEEKYRSLVEGSDQVIAVVDAHGCFRFANHTAHLHLGVEPGSVVGRSMRDLFPPPVAERQMDGIRLALTEGRPLVLQNPSSVRGQARWYETRLLPLRGADGQFDAVQLVATDITLRKEVEEQILSYQERLRSLSAELAVSEQRERRRIAAELHDRIGQALAISKIRLSQLRDGAIGRDQKKTLDELWSLTDQTIRDTRSLTFELCPPVLYELGLEHALEWLVERFRGQHETTAEFHDDGAEKPLGPDLQGLLFQAAQELLINAAKHAQATRVSVGCSRDRNQIVIEVADDGVGFDPAVVLASAAGGSVPSGFGLFSIRERLGHIGGRLEIVSSPGQGTRAFLRAPLAPPASEGGKES